MGAADVYLTEEGRTRLAAELNDLVGVRRPGLQDDERRMGERAGLDARAEREDISVQRGFLEGRIHELQRILAAVVIIEEPRGVDFVRIGSRIRVADQGNEEENYHLVSPQEADPRNRLISNESPMGRALFGRKVGDEVTVVAPGGSFRLRVLGIA